MLSSDLVRSALDQGDASSAMHAIQHDGRVRMTSKPINPDQLPDLLRACTKPFGSVSNRTHPTVGARCGPYKRYEQDMKTDEQVQKDVVAELAWEPSINATQISVEVADGIVTLVGHVGSYAEKINAEHVAQRVAGVKGIAVELEVKLIESNQRTDADIARSAQSVLQWTTSLPPDGVKVKVENGWISLSGDVEWEFQKKVAVKAVHHLLGVTGVSDMMAIKPSVSATIVKSEIEMALKRAARNDAQDITVEVRGSDVTLTGPVYSWSERELVRSSAWATPGVRNVVDNMTVAF
jgi:osmotically-inducible protein OsmY